MDSGAASSPTLAARNRSRGASPASDEFGYGNRGSIQTSNTTSIHKSLSTLLDNEKFSDMIIICGGRQFKAHRAIVCTQSSIIDRAMTSNFKEATLRSIELEKDDPNIVERLLEFLYTGTYSDGVTCGNQETDTKSSVQGSEQEVSGDEEQNTPPDNDVAAGDENNELPMETDGPAVHHQSEGSKRHADPSDDMTLHLRLYLIAVKYKVPALQTLALDRFCHAVELVWKDAERFPAMVDELYDTMPPRGAVLKETLCRLVGTAIHDQKVRRKLKAVFEKHGEFAFGVMDYAIKFGPGQMTEMA